MYADDVVIFLRPSAADISTTLNILDLFGKASGLRNNEQKSNVFPIQCPTDDLVLVQNLLPFERSEFPCKYLGIPLSLHKLTREQIQSIIDRVADRLPSWKADLMTRAGRKIMVQHVLSSMIIYLAMAIDFPQWALEAIDKIRKGFLWKGRKEVRGGHCLVAWGRVCRPLHLGGLGISSLKELCWALRMRWLWLHKTDPEKPWANLPIQVPKKAEAFFSTVLVSKVGNGAHTLFWTDKWILGQNVCSLAPRLFAIIPKRIANRRTVLEALANRKWISDIKGALSVGVLVDYLNLWELLSEIVLQPEVEDKHIFSIAADGKYSAKSAYEGLFAGSTSFGLYHLIWKTWAPPKCRFFLWLVANKRCWTADRLAKRGLDHPARCLFCDQEAETIDHILVSCVFTRVFWFTLLKPFGFQSLTPQPGHSSFMAWWEQISGLASGIPGKGLNSLVALGAWITWKHRNSCVFDGCTPSLDLSIKLAREER